MHEISVVRSLIELVEEQLPDAGGTHVASVTVGIGPLSGVVPMAMQFAFDVATYGTVMQGARLEIQTNGLVVWCQKCGVERVPADFNRLRCPVCKERTPTIVRGTEMELLRIEVLDGADGNKGKHGDDCDDAGDPAADPGGSPANLKEE